MNSSKAIFWYVALLLDEWFCSFWTLCWSNTDLIVSMHTWQRPCFRKEGSQIHSCIKPTESKLGKARGEKLRFWREMMDRVWRLLVQPSWSNHPPTTHTLPALQNRLNYRFHLLWNALRSTLSTLSSAWHFIYDVINDSSEVIAESKSFEIFLHRSC